MYNLPQKLVAEFIGTFTLVFIGAGSICADQYLTSTGQSGLGLLGIAAATGSPSASWSRRSGTSPAAISIPRLPSASGSLGV